MAELIPIRYRLRALMRQRIERWVIGTLLVACLCAAAVASTYALQLRAGTRLAALRSEYQNRQPLIGRSKELRGKRQDLAQRMQKIQQLMDDRVLLSLMHSLSEGFSGNDCLEYIHIDARGTAGNGAAAGGGGAPDGNHFVVRITGITSNSTTLAQLMTRLTQKSEPRVNVVLESSRRENFLDGQVMRFQIRCEHGTPKG